MLDLREAAVVNSVQAAQRIADWRARIDAAVWRDTGLHALIEAAEVILAERDALAAENGRIRADLRTLDATFREMREGFAALGLDDELVRPATPDTPAEPVRLPVRLPDPQRDPTKHWFRRASA